MTFAWPSLLWLLLLPAALLVWELSRRKNGGAAATHPKILRAELGKSDIEVVRDPSRNGRRTIRPWLAAGLVFGIIALARPQWGRIEEPVFDQSREILLAVDLSRSMLSPDVKPSRLDRSKLLIQSLLEKLEGERVGLVVFSGTAFLQSPLSADYEILREFLPALGPDFLPEGGTNYRALLDTSLDAFSSTSSADRFLIILSDGEATDDDWKPRIEELTKRGIRVISLGVGTVGGTMIPDGSGGFVKDARGAVVLSRLEPGTLQQLAEATNGVYRDASSWLDLSELIEQTVNAGRKGEFVEKNTVRYVERFQWPLALALWCFLVSFYYEFPVRPRTRDIALRGRTGKPGPTTPPKLADAAATASKAPTAPGAATLLFLLLVPTAVFGPKRAHAAVSLAPVQPQGSIVPAPAPAAPNPLDSAPLSKIVGRLSAADNQTARDWSELAHETIIWGSRLQSAQRPVPEGPVRDALTAVDLGSKLDARAAEWPQLRTQLEALLQKPEPPKQPQQNQQQQKKDQQQQQQDQQKQQNQQQKDQQQQQQQPEQQKQQDQPQQKQNENPSSPEEQKEQQQQSAFGDMNKPQPPPPSETQKVGGAQEKQEPPKEPVDPALAVPLEKLQQLKDKDSPAQLFEMLQGDRTQDSRKKPTKDW